MDGLTKLKHGSLFLLPVSNHQPVLLFLNHDLNHLITLTMLCFTSKSNQGITDALSLYKSDILRVPQNTSMVFL